MKNHDIGDGFN